ncbi:MAG: hypothetical protein LBJ67_14530 [Planctomycetaceae bacterium]|nr:hypothetical protein [Planctomycetaceae bacterium]
MSDSKSFSNFNEKQQAPVQQSTDKERRKMLGQILVGGTAAIAATGVFFSREEEVLAATLARAEEQRPDLAAKPVPPKEAEIDALSGASRQNTNWAKFGDLKKPMAKAAFVGDIKLSRMFLGGNLIGGWAHARDLIYVSDLVKAYHTREKIYATFQMAEACGINAYLGHHSHIGILNDYWEKKSGTLQYIADCSDLEGAKRCIELGAAACYIQGEANDRLVREKKFDEVKRFLETVREEGVPVGLGGHYIETIRACVEQNLLPDFWMKTIHHDRYWSRRAGEQEHDNVFCRKPQETIEFMNALPQPWIGFKVLAAGAIRPDDGFRFAFEAGADFLCVGHYDFQIVDNVNTCMNILESNLKRTRPWIGA